MKKCRLDGQTSGGRFVPIQKMSKKERRAFYQSRRGVWGALSPVTRKSVGNRAYNRKKVRQEGETFHAEPFS